jgi:hypothetical protein
MSSTHTYNITGSDRKDKLGLASKTVDIALNPEELESMDAETLKRKFEEGSKASKVQGSKEDLSDMVAEHADRHSKRSRKERKDFKF